MTYDDGRGAGHGYGHGYGPGGGYPGAGVPWNEGPLRPENHLVWGVFTTLFCCLPLGFVSIVKAARVDSLWAAGDVEGAMRASEDARRFAMWGSIIGPLLIVLMLVVVFVTGAGSLSEGL